MDVLLLALFFGGLIGLSLGVIGGGGSILTVPVLVSVFGLDARSAITTSLIIVGATALVGAAPHWRRGRVVTRTALIFGAIGILGAFVGTWFNHLVPEWLVLVLFGLLMIAVSARMLLSKGDLPADGGHQGPKTHSWIAVIAAAFGVGAMTGFFGVGGGFLIVPALVLVLGYQIHIAVGTSLLVIAVNSFSGFGAHILSTSFDLDLTIMFFAGGAAGAIAGSAIGSRVNGIALQRGFALFISLIGVWLIASNAPGIT